MSVTDEEFFKENIVSVNRMVEKVFFFCLLVPVSFIILTICGIWFIPYKYTAGLFIFTIIATLTLHILNKKEIHQIFSMYLGIICSIIFVDLLGFNSVIVITISYGFAPFLSCLYYNRRLTTVTNIVTYLTLIFVIYCRSLTIQNYYKFVQNEQTEMELDILLLQELTELLKILLM